MPLVLLRLFFYWMGIFTIGRSIFLFWNFDLLQPSEQTLQEVLACYGRSLPLDASMASYLLVIPWMILVGKGAHRSLLASRLLWIFTGSLVVLYTGLAIAETLVYPDWKQKLNARILTTLAHPSEILRVASLVDLAQATTFWILFAALALRPLSWILKPVSSNWRGPKLKIWAWLATWAVVIGVTARGGTKAIAIDVSRVYFSRDPVFNDAAVNPANYLIRSVMQSRMHLFGTNIFAAMPSDKAALIGAQLAPRSTQPDLKIVKDGPINLIFVVLESWSADLIGSLGGRREIAPHFAQWEKEGLLFSRFYANGNRSQQGIGSIFGAFPALPRTTITEDPAKTRKLPGLARFLEEAGYNTSFHYGGQLEYGNIRSFLVDSGFQTLVEDADLPRSLPRANLGVHDGAMYPVFTNFLAERREPFMAALFTLSSHAPYDIPNPERFQFEEREASYVRSAMYADAELGRFLAVAKSQPWYNRTLIVITSDHSHNSYINRSTHDPNYRKIPLLITGGALKDELRGQVWPRIGSQIDLVATLLHQLSLDPSPFQWSKDLFSAQDPEFAYYEFNDGVGWITPQGSLLYDFEEKSLVKSSIIDADLERTTKEQAIAYLQRLFQSFIDL